MDESPVNPLARLEPKIRRVFFFSLVVKIILGVMIPLSPDEAYYWVWSLKPQLSYFDHPAFVALLNWMGQPLDDFYSAVRIPGILMGHATTFVWLILLKPYFSDDQRFWWMIFALIWPMTGPGSIIVTPDIPLMFFWSLTLLFVQKLVAKPSFPVSLLAGFSLGFGFSSKYTMVLILPIILVWMWKGIPNKQLFFILVGLGFLGSLITSFPVWYWNLTNDMSSIGFQLGHGFLGKFKLKYPIEYIAAQVGLLFPTTLFFAKNGLKRAPNWLILSAIVPLIFFAVASFFSSSEANWPIVAHPSVIALAILGKDRLSVPVAMIRTAFVYGALTFLVILQVFVPWIPRGDFRLKTDIFHEFDEIADYAKGKSNLFARSYQMASAVSFQNKSLFFKARGLNRIDAFDFFPESDPPKRFEVILEKDEKFKRVVREKYAIEGRKSLNQNFDVVRVVKK